MIFFGVVGMKRGRLIQRRESEESWNLPRGAGRDCEPETVHLSQA